MSDISGVKALVFDVFGTVVDWRTSLINDFTKWADANGKTRRLDRAGRWLARGLCRLDGRGAQEPAEPATSSSTCCIANPWKSWSISSASRD